MRAPLDHPALNLLFSPTHTEIPAQVNGRLAGVQLWINMPGALKMETAPFYRDLPDARMPRLVGLPPGVTARVVLGAPPGPSHPPTQPDPALVRPITAATVLDVAWEDGSTSPASIPLPAELTTAAVLCVSGSITVGGEVGQATLSPKQLAVLAPGEDGSGSSVLLTPAGPGARALILAGRPLGEPIVAAGPFVLTSEEDASRAWADFQAGRFGPAPPSPPRE